MRILFVTPRFPYPLLKGDQVVPYHRLRILSQKHEITLLSMYERDEELAGINHLLPYCKEIHTVRLTKPQSMLNVVTRAPFSRLPMQVLYYHSPEFRKCLTKVLAQGSFDLVHSYLMRLAPALTDLQVPVVADLIDSMQLNFARRVTKERPPKQWIFQEELRRVTAYERQMCDFFDHLIVVSDLDRDYIPGNVHVIPNGVDTDHFIAAPHLPVDPVLVFSGNMGYAPNIHAITWFIEHCFDRIRAEVPGAHLVVAGANPSKEIQAFATIPGVTVTGFVESMVNTLHKARLAIAPMQTGSGVQNKILEAMACELPVVTTRLGLGSLKAVAERDIVVAEDPTTFADQVIELLKNATYSKALGRHAREFVLRHHSWDNAADQVEEVYGLVLGGKSLG